MEQSKLLEIFKKEADSNLNALEQGLQIIAANSEDRNLLTFLYRHIHTLKGSASMMRFTQLAKLATALEDLFDRMRSDVLGVNPIFADILNDALFLLRKGVANVVEGREEEIEVDDVIAAISRHLASRQTTADERTVRVCSLAHPFFKREKDLLMSWRRAVDQGEVKVPEGRKPRVLIVEDSEMTLSLESSLLSSYGYDVDTASDGEQGLKMAKEGSYDLILSDIQMPRMNGYEFCGHVKEDPALKNIPFVFLTSLENDKDKERARSSGADAFVLKSNFKESELLALLYVMTLPEAA